MIKKTLLTVTTLGVLSTLTLAATSGSSAISGGATMTSGTATTPYGIITSGSDTLLSKEVGQMMVVGFAGTTITPDSPIVQEIKYYHIGGVIVFPTNADGSIRNISSPAQLALITSQLQAYAKQYNDYPLFIAANQEGGYINGLKPKTGFTMPLNNSQLQLGKSSTTDLAYNQAIEFGNLLSQYGVNMNMAPVSDLCLNPNSQVIARWERSFGTNPTKVTALLEAQLSAYNQTGTIAMMKHFPGLGSAQQNTDDDAFVNVTNVYQKQELYPYQAIIKSKYCPPVIMVSHEINTQFDPSGLPASLSYDMVNNLLRKQLGFKGVVMTDDMDAAAIQQCFTNKEAIYLAVTAGDNLIVYGGSLGTDPYNDANEEYSNLMSLAQTDANFAKNVDTSYQLISKLKNTMVTLQANAVKNPPKMKTIKNT